MSNQTIKERNVFSDWRTAEQRMEPHREPPRITEDSLIVRLTKVAVLIFFALTFVYIIR